VFSISIEKVQHEFQLENLTPGVDLSNIFVNNPEINRPGLQVAGYLDYFGNDRIQILGRGEMEYLKIMSLRERVRRIDNFFKKGFPCIIMARNLEAYPEIIESGLKYGIPILRSPDITSRLMSSLINFLNVQLAPRENRHGVLVEVYGEGILILGESGVGKSEAALELVKRGHRLVADDNVEIRKVSDKTLVGTSPDIIRHFIEIRGLGILDVKTLYGLGSVKLTETINVVINLELWDIKKEYDRLGLTEEFIEILGIKVPSLTIPVRPGRNLAIIVEVAAMNNRQKKMGYNAAQALTDRILKEMNGKGMYDHTSDVF
jgi:HPr kinase/phosphorylase